jgi:hypothetical protein
MSSRDRDVRRTSAATVVDGEVSAFPRHLIDFDVGVTLRGHTLLFGRDGDFDQVIVLVHVFRPPALDSVK